MSELDWTTLASLGHEALAAHQLRSWGDHERKTRDEPLTGDESHDRAVLAREHVSGFCRHPYPMELRRWPLGVKRATARLYYLRWHGSVGLFNASARVRRAAERARRTVHPCSCGRAYTLETLPEWCECGVGHFGSWARVLKKLPDAPKRGAP